MEHLGSWILTIVESSGTMAPVLFIILHLLRPFFFLPVAFICVSGGILFGMVTGTVYSVIGVTLSSIAFYQMASSAPGMINRLIRLKGKMLGEHTKLSKGQLILLRLMPFIHFHLLSLCIIEMSKSFREYVRLSVMSNVPLAFVYTSFGKWISTMSPLVMGMVVIALLPLLYLIRQKEIVMKWEDFFNKNAHTSVS
ncbi:putative membrane protein YdjX (TVP38/TMEM64 family) [Melghiribacillus thermohalophilus]|uniref:Putative membrane protein YdjX (TVP38/TMEM64 family) n=1 Tax=Melghiribacillus thermohalophilus TaxID=1324956 RepID=A0A4R3N918_9BACI|nr:VTT domain-containing protein [Melghiribacillus thermohalophilus]TCT25031.1 putative membrane protein YdjX (TVP38/TMEM64 family) [Melghiribacillus thermohalophilus]